MSDYETVKVKDVMKRDFDLFDGKLTVEEALLQMRFPETRMLIIDKRDENDEYGLVLISDIAKQILGADRSPRRVNLYEIMAKPVLSVHSEMTIKNCAKLLERFSIMRAPVIDQGGVVGVVSFHDLVLIGLLSPLKNNNS